MTRTSPRKPFVFDPNNRVTQWIAKQANETLFIGVVSIGELRRAFIAAPDPQRRTRFKGWLQNDLLMSFDGRILARTKRAYTILRIPHSVVECVRFRMSVFA